jgi:hypothetical protein
MFDTREAIHRDRKICMARGLQADGSGDNPFSAVFLALLLAIFQKLISDFFRYYSISADTISAFKNPSTPL